MNKLEEKTLSSEVVFQGRFLKVKRDQVKTPSGGIAHREYILHPGAAMIVPILPNGDLVLVRQYRHALKQVFYEFPAGKKDPGEVSLITAKRELKEETGFTSKQWSFLTRIHPVIGYSDEFIDLFLAEGLIEGEMQLDDGEHIELERMSLNKFSELIQQQKVSDVKTLAGIMWYEKILKGEWKRTPV